MSWQGNECLIGNIDYVEKDSSGRMIEAINSLLMLYGEKGNGWYLLGHFSSNTTEDEFVEYKKPRDYEYCEHRMCWLPNPFMHPGVFAVNIQNPHDIVNIAFDCAKHDYEAIAYAGDGAEPLERMVIYGKEHNFRNK